jgi:hypothetical protein
MNPVDSHILEILQSQRDVLLKETTDIVYASGGATMDRASTEQLLRGAIAIVEESISGAPSDQRRMYLDAALPEVARSGNSPWRTVLSDGLPCWGVIVGLIAARANETHRNDAIVRLSRLMGTWWAEVWDVMSPVYRSKGEL